MQSSLNSVGKLFIALFFLGQLTFGQSQVTKVEPGHPLERELKAGEKDVFSMDAAADHFMHLTVMQKGIDVVVSLVSPDGKKLLEVDSPNGKNGPERLWFVAGQAGRYTVEVISLEKVAAPGKFEISMDEPRLATADDRNFVLGETAIQEGLALGDPEDPAVKANALERYTEAARLFGLIESNKALKADGYGEVARATGSVGRDDLARQYYDESAAIYLSSGKKPEAINALVGSRKYAVSQLNRIATDNRIHKMAVEIGDNAYEQESLIDMGASYFELGDFSRALQLDQEALQIAIQTDNKVRMDRSYDNMGAILTAQGNYAAALESHQKALDLQATIGNKEPDPSTLLNIGNVYFQTDNYDLAIEYYQKAKDAFESRKGARVGVAYAVDNIGSAYLELGQYDKALEYYIHGQKLKSAFLSDDPTTFYNLATVYQKMNRVNDAFEAAQQAVELAKKVDDNDGLAYSLILLSELYYGRNELKKSLDVANEAVSIATRYDSPTRLWLAYLAAANAQIGMGKQEDARVSLERSIATIELLRKQVVAGEDSSERFFEEKSNPYLAMIALTVSSGDREKAFSLSETIKARTLFEALAGGKVEISHALTPNEHEAESCLKNELASLSSSITTEHDKTRLELIESQLKTKRLELEDFRTRLYASHPELAVHRGEMKPVSLDETKSLVRDQRAAVAEFVVAKDKTFLFLISKNAEQKAVLNVFTIDASEKQLSDKIASYRDKLAAGDLDFQPMARDLYGLLLKPAAAQLGGKTNLIVVPDGRLWDLPFQALMDEKGKFLAERMAVSYAPSLTALREMQKKAKERKASADAELVAFGNPIVAKETTERVQRVFMSEKLEPIPEAERLVNDLGRMYGPRRSKVFTGAAAREETAKTESPKYRIVQFATHGILNNASPMYSHLVLAQDAKDPNEDGLLEAWELKDLDLKADMVILSACDTARGRISSGEGVIGMTWASFIAGAPTTVASQWKVESSSTTELMLEFHRQLLTGKVSKAEALRRAELKLLHNPKYSHPSYWGGWVLVGNGN